MFLLALFSSAYGQTCDVNDNLGSFYDMNPSCNNAGRCAVDNSGDGYCDCCNRYDSQKWDISSTGGAGCYGNLDWTWGSYTGTNCEEYEIYIYGTLKYLVETDNSASGAFGTTGFDAVGTAGEFTCPDVPNANNDEDQTDSDPSMLANVAKLVNEATSTYTDDSGGYMNYDGILQAITADEDQPQVCKACGTGWPYYCYVYVDGSPEYYETDGQLLLTYSTDFNTHYDETCTFRSCTMPDCDIPTTQHQSMSQPGCSAKQDKGADAFHTWFLATLGTDQGTQHQAMLEAWNKEALGANNRGLGWTSNTKIKTIYVAVELDKEKLGSALTFPTLSPTRMPSPSPTPAPVGVPDCFTLGYTHQLSSLVFKGVTAGGCRSGLSDDWPGGQGCDSPYVICLPQENTPNVGFPLGLENYRSDTHRYTIEECKQECAFDQRCLGFEFDADTDSTLGDCKLIDDIPVVTNDIGANGFCSGGVCNEGLLAGMSNLSSANLGGTICFAKENYCNPFFQQHELNEVMLSCYCPDNRKGFYTKKVIRTPEASVYCGTETEEMLVTKRIKEAQANRMFHLCENWCLFNTQTPREESWYHDPWNECWREQYAGFGKHRSYCFRVIRDPQTIEMQFIDERSSNMCQVNSAGVIKNTVTPTQSPVGLPDVEYFLALEEDSCDDTCEKRNMRCALTHTNLITNAFAAGTLTFGTEAIAQTIWSTTGFACTGATFPAPDAAAGWAFPGTMTNGNVCITRHDTTADTPCNLAIGVGYRRLCACTDAAT